LGRSHLFLLYIKRVSSKLFLTIPPPAKITFIFFLKFKINFSEFLWNKNIFLCFLTLETISIKEIFFISNKLILEPKGILLVNIITFSLTKTLYICFMVLNKYTAKKTAELLLQIKAIKLNSKNPFTWASGWKSPIYCDNRIILSHPQIRIFVKEQIVKQIEELYGKPDVIAGVATGAIGIGMLVADMMNLPFIYVRPNSKKHGRKNQIEGQYSKSQKVIVIEDLISTGNSSLMAVDALREEELIVKGMISIFTYGFDVSYSNFKSKNVELYTLSSYDFLLEQALDINYISDSEFKTLKEWKKNPSEWNPEKD
jgi:orotate phosphoribosyltransferase